MAFDWDNHLGSILEAHDVLGTTGCKWPLRRQTLLVEPVRRLLVEDGLILESYQIFAEGLGYDSFAKDILEIPSDLKTDQMISIEWQSMQRIPECGGKRFIYNVAETHALHGPMFIFNEQSRVFTLYDKSQGPIRMVEFFSGGFGGWKRGAQQLEDDFHQPFFTVGIERDIQIAATYAISHRANLVCNPQQIEPEVFRQSRDNWVLCCDIWDDHWLPCISSWSPELAVISSPCKPWSGASTSQGLCKEDGRLLIRAILSCRFFRPRCIAIEQVPGFSHHPHKFWVIKTLLFCGYRLVWSKVVDLQDQSPTSRPRWLGVAVRIHDHFPEVKCSHWKKFQNCTPSAIDAVMQLSMENLLPLHVSEKALSIASSVGCYKGPPLRSTDQKAVLNTRIYGEQQCLPTFMAMYGSQHCFEMDFLQKHGFFGHFKCDPQCPSEIRYWHPIEVALIHGITSPCYLDDLMASSWLILGNMISQPHALFVLTDVCNRLRGLDLKIEAVIDKFQEHRFRASAIEPQSIRDGTLWISKIALSPFALSFRDPVFQVNSVQLLEHVHHHAVFHCWTPSEGIMSTDLFVQKLCQAEDSLSEVSREVISPTLPMEVDNSDYRTLCWKLSSGRFCTYLVKGSTSVPALMELWGNLVELQLGSQGFQIGTIAQNDSSWPNFVSEHSLLVVLLKGEFRFCNCDPQDVILTSGNLPAGPDIWYDAYDVIKPGQTRKSGQIICDFPIHQGLPPCDAPFILAATQQTECQLKWFSNTDTISIQIQGTETAVLIMLEFWGQAIQENDLHKLGRKCIITQRKDSGSVIFTPVGGNGACPPAIFIEILCMCATRVLLDAFPGDKGSQVLLKWQGRPLWLGSLPQETPLSTIMASIRYSLSLMTGTLEVRLVNHGKNHNPDTLISELKSSNGRTTMHLVHELTGGGPSKQQTRTLLRNSLASTFLEQGHDIQWVSGAVDSLVAKIGISRLQTVVNTASVATRLSSLNKLCTEIDLKIPGPTKNSSQLDFSGAPWNKKKTRKEVAPITASEFTITPGFFQNEDGSNATQLSGLRAQACGVCILDPPTALEWLRGNNCISSDELGAFVIGQLPCETSLPVCQITAPCLNANGQSVLLSGRFVQFGSKTIKFCQSSKKTSQPEHCHLLAITLQREDWSEEQWTQAVHNPVAFVKKILANDHQDGDLIAVWGRSLRQGRAPASPMQASSLQVHCTIASNKIEGILRTSGFNRLYMTPKEPSGKLDLGFKILWVEGTLGEATAVGARIPDCLGLIKGKQTFGLRFRADKYPAAWEVVYPGTQPPKRLQGDLLFKISGLPFGCTSTVIQDWGQTLSWDIAAVKALGPQAWLVRSAAHPKEGFHLFNSTPVLIQHLPPRSSQQAPVLLGPRARPSAGDTTNFDPWANWTGPRLVPPREQTTSTPSTRQVTGPIEERFANQDATIAAIRTELQELSQKQDEQNKLTDHRFQQAEDREKKNLSQMQADMKNMQQDLEKSLTASLNQNAQTLDTRLRELKELFVTSKRKSPGVGGDDPME